MNKIANCYRFLLIAFSFTLASCEDIIDVDLRSVEPIIVIEGVVKSGTLPEVRISTTKEFTATNEYLPVKDAVVEIWDNAGNRETLPFVAASGKYTATNTGLTGTERRTYNMSVKYQGEEYLATSFMPPLVELDSLTLHKISLLDYPGPMIHFTDPIGKENEHYRFLVYINDKRFNPHEWLLSTEHVDGKAIHQTILLFPENDGDDDPVQPGDEITVEMQCMDGATFDFFETMDNVEDGLANPTSNITGGALGYFGAYSTGRKSIIADFVP